MEENFQSQQWYWEWSVKFPFFVSSTANYKSFIYFFEREMFSCIILIPFKTIKKKERKKKRTSQKKRKIMKILPKVFVEYIKMLSSCVVTTYCKSFISLTSAFLQLPFVCFASRFFFLSFVDWQLLFLPTSINTCAEIQYLRWNEHKNKDIKYYVTFVKSRDVKINLSFPLLYRSSVSLGGG